VLCVVVVVTVFTGINNNTQTDKFQFSIVVAVGADRLLEAIA